MFFNHNKLKIKTLHKTSNQYFKKLLGLNVRNNQTFQEAFQLQ
jgi:hypothetical protein